MNFPKYFVCDEKGKEDGKGTFWNETWGFGDGSPFGVVLEDPEPQLPLRLPSLAFGFGQGAVPQSVLWGLCPLDGHFPLFSVPSRGIMVQGSPVKEPSPAHVSQIVQCRSWTHLLILCFYKLCFLAAYEMFCSTLAELQDK